MGAGHTTCACCLFQVSIRSVQGSVAVRADPVCALSAIGAEKGAAVTADAHCCGVAILAAQSAFHVGHKGTSTMYRLPVF